MVWHRVSQCESAWKDTHQAQGSCTHDTGLYSYIQHQLWKHFPVIPLVLLAPVKDLVDCHHFCMSSSLQDKNKYFLKSLHLFTFVIKVMYTITFHTTQTAEKILNPRKKIFKPNLLCAAYKIYKCQVFLLFPRQRSIVRSSPLLVMPAQWGKTWKLCLRFKGHTKCTGTTDVAHIPLYFQKQEYRLDYFLWKINKVLLAGTFFSLWQYYCAHKELIHCEHATISVCFCNCQVCSVHTTFSVCLRFNAASGYIHVQ